MRMGILGGTFDPVHYGHLLLAETCREACQLAEVRFIPAAVPPHKQDRQRAPDQQRVDMLELALGGHAAFSVSQIEVDRGGVSYTVDTLQTLHDQSPDAELFLLLGADTLQDLPNWREPARVCQLATLAVVRRPGAIEPDFHELSDFVTPERIEVFRRFVVEMPMIGLSSTDIRQRVEAGQTIRFRTPRAVEKYIETAGLYQAKSA